MSGPPTSGPFLTATSSWDSVYELQTTDAVEGGDDGASNWPLQNLANRDQYLSDSLASEVARAKKAEALLAPLASPTFTGTVSAPAMNVTSGSIELGSTTAASTSYLDFHSSGNAIDFDGRISSTGGNSSVGQGNIAVSAASFSVPAPTNGNSTQAATTAWVAETYAPLSGPSFTGQSQFSYGAMTDPDSGVARDAKFGNKGIAVVGGVKTDTLNVTGAATLAGATSSAAIVAPSFNATGASNGFAVGNISSGSVAAFIANMATGYTNYLLQLGINNTLLYYVDQTGAMVSEAGGSFAKAVTVGGTLGVSGGTLALSGGANTMFAIGTPGTSGTPNVTFNSSGGAAGWLDGEIYAKGGSTQTSGQATLYYSAQSGHVFNATITNTYASGQAITIGVLPANTYAGIGANFSSSYGYDLIQLMVGGVTLFSVGSAGDLITAGNLTVGPSAAIGSQSTAGSATINLYSAGSATASVGITSSGGSTSTPGQGAMSIAAGSLTIPSPNNANSAQAATTAFATAAVAAEAQRAEQAEGLLAPRAGPSFSSQSQFANGAFSDPDSGVARDAKFGTKGIAVLGGTKTDTLNVTGTSTLAGATTFSSGTTYFSGGNNTVVAIGTPGTTGTPNVTFNASGGAAGWLDAEIYAKGGSTSNNGQGALYYNAQAGHTFNSTISVSYATGQAITIGTLPANTYAGIGANFAKGYGINLVQLFVDGSQMFSVDNGGNTAVAGSIAAGGSISAGSRINAMQDGSGIGFAIGTPASGQVGAFMANLTAAYGSNVIDIKIQGTAIFSVAKDGSVVSAAGGSFQNTVSAKSPSNFDSSGQLATTSYGVANYVKQGAWSTNAAASANLLNNAVFIGWQNGGTLGLVIDSTYIGTFAMQPWVTGNFLSLSTGGTVVGQITTDVSLTAATDITSSTGNVVSLKGAVKQGGQWTDTATPISDATDGVLLSNAVLAYSSTQASGHFGVSNGNGPIVSYYYSSTNIGNVLSVNGTTVNYSTTSDYRLKENVVPVTSDTALDRIRAYRPVEFNFKSCPVQVRGFIAHEVQQVSAQAVHGEKDAIRPKRVRQEVACQVETGAIDADGKPVVETQMRAEYVDHESETEIAPQMVDHSQLVVDAIAGCKALLSFVEGLQATTERLQTRVQELEARLARS